MSVGFLLLGLIGCVLTLRVGSCSGYGPKRAWLFGKVPLVWVGLIYYGLIAGTGLSHSRFAIMADASLVVGGITFTALYLMPKAKRMVNLCPGCRYIWVYNLVMFAFTIVFCVWSIST